MSTPDNKNSVMTARRPGYLDLTGLEISEADFNRFSRLIYDQCGIKMPAHKKSMLEARLRKRLRALRMESYEEYRDFLFSDEGMQHELVNMIDVVTTNKTDFFREPRHFDYLTGNVLPQIVPRFGIDKGRPLRLWSAGCSTGEEPYTIAIFLEEYNRQGKAIDYRILATDISTQVLEKAVLGIYHFNKIEPVPEAIRKRYLLKNRNPEIPQVRIVPEIRAKMNFRRMNFMSEQFDVPETQDVIFCRNVIIYFDRPTQERFLAKLCEFLRPGGYLFMGHSETLSGMPLPLVQKAPAVYQRT